jgi:NAD-dependent deacetylase
MRSSETVPGIVVLTGAGISRESGLDTFRDVGGVWQQVRLEDVCTPEGFRRDPERVHAFYNSRRAQLREVEPNAAHRALAELEEAWALRGGRFLLVTQNVDDLHERAGSRRIVHMHGRLLSAWCLACDGRVDWADDTGALSRCPECGAVGQMRPDIVWFGEVPYGMDRIGAALEWCGLFLSIGTSGSVWPAAGFVAEVRGRARTVELNLEPSLGSGLFDEARHGPASAIVPAFVAALLAETDRRRAAAR